MNSLPNMQGLRHWQEEALRAYFSEARRDFTVTATPGAGKTTFALRAALHLKESRIIDRIIVVAPTDHLRLQWSRAAAEFGISLDAKLANNQKLRPSMHGYVTTYAQVAAHPILHQRRTELPNRTLVILDEIHHAGDGLTWGDAIQEAFGGAARRITMTGTPFRTSRDERIPFVRYEDDGDGLLRSCADYAYEYAAALRDHVVRPVVFAAYSGVSSWMTSAGDILSADLSEPATKRQEMQAWKTALNPDGQWVAHVLGAANERLTEMRSTGMPDAGCLILASDQDSARDYARVVKAVTGHTATVVLSDDPAASKRISTFSNGTERFIVAVRMVSEGVDIRRLGCLVWLTSYQTPLFFAQAVGRVVRARNAAETATVFVPSVRPLLALAAEMETSRDHVLAPPKEAPDDFDAINVDRPEPEKGSDGVTQSISSEARFGHVLFGGRAIVPTAGQDLSSEDEEFLGLPGLLSPEQSALLLAQREVERSRTQSPTTRTTTAAVKNESEQASEYRREIASLVSIWAGRSGIEIPKAHVLVRNAVPGPKNAEASIEVLRTRRDWLLEKTH